MMPGRDQIFQWLTGRSDVDLGSGRDVAGMLMAAGGPSDRTKSGIDLTRAAAKLGVSRRTVERWHRAAQDGRGQRPSPSHMRALVKAARQASTTKAGRSQWVARQRANPRYQDGAHLVIDAYQGPGDSEGEHMRDRKVVHRLERDDIEGFWSAYEQGGDRGVISWLGERGNDYLAGWRTGEIYGITLDSPDSRNP